MDPEILKLLWGIPGEPVPPVDPEELKTVFCENRSVGPELKAVACRTMMLSAVVIDPSNALKPWIKDGLPQDVVFRVMAGIQMTWPEIGGSTNYPIDTADFFRQLIAANEIRTD
jgi:hypothetical protein